MTQKSEKQIKYTLATHALEKFTPSLEALRLSEQISNGELNADAAVSMVLRQYNLERVRDNG